MSGRLSREVNLFCAKTDSLSLSLSILEEEEEEQTLPADRIIGGKRKTKSLCSSWCAINFLAISHYSTGSGCVEEEEEESYF